MVSGLGFVLGVDGGTFVFDISDVTVVVVSGVGDGLDTTIGKSNLVRSGDSLAVGGFLGVEVGARVVIGNSVLVGEGLGREFFYWVGFGVWSRGMVWWWGWASWDTSNSGNKCETNKSLNVKAIK